MDWIARLRAGSDLEDEGLRALLAGEGPDEELFAAADQVRREHYGDAVYVRGLIEISSYCRNDCLYCGIRKSNSNARRYRLDQETILSCCREGYALGYRTFVLQGGEDPFFADDVLCGIVRAISREFPGCAVTLSVGERSLDSYKKLYDAGARRFLLRHEAASEELYRKLHPPGMSRENRMQCLFDLKKIGYQVGSGFMVGAPFQRTEHLIEDIRFLQKLSPDMIGIGPYLNHRETPFRDQPSGSMIMTLRLLAILRLMFPWALLPSTTALASIDPSGRQRGLQAGANVVMPNLSPADVRDKYSIYDNKLSTGNESAQNKADLEKVVRAAGYRIVTDRGDVKR
ncbi:MAG: [Firmicutes bacterium]|nr:[FeFe] hydrogenase H-cluster radical SAM maturase HydE [Bacillota bacterium]